MSGASGQLAREGDTVGVHSMDRLAAYAFTTAAFARTTKFWGIGCNAVRLRGGLNPNYCSTRSCSSAGAFAHSFTTVEVRVP